MVRSVGYGRSTTAACDFCRQSRCAQSHMPSSFRLCVLCAHAAAPRRRAPRRCSSRPSSGGGTYATCQSPVGGRRAARSACTPRLYSGESDFEASTDFNGVFGQSLPAVAQTLGWRRQQRCGVDAGAALAARDHCSQRACWLNFRAESRFRDGTRPASAPPSPARRAFTHLACTRCCCCSQHEKRAASPPGARASPHFSAVSKTPVGGDRHMWPSRGDDKFPPPSLDSGRGHRPLRPQPVDAHDQPPAWPQAVQRGDATRPPSARRGARGSPGLRVAARALAHPRARRRQPRGALRVAPRDGGQPGQAARHHVVGQRRDLHARHRALRPRAAARAAVRADGGQVVRQEGRLQRRARRRRGRASNGRKAHERSPPPTRGGPRCSAPRRTSTPSPARAATSARMRRTSATAPRARASARRRATRAATPTAAAASLRQRRSATEIATASRGWRSRARCRASSGSPPSPRAPAATA